MLLCRLVCFSLLPLSALLVAQTSTEPHAQLPVRRVVLYKNGVGYFEHAGRVTGNQALTIDFTSSQLDDALQSLTALDLGGGRITGVGYNSTTPLDQQLKNIPLGLDDQPSTDDLYGALRGARVEVSGPGEAALSGRIVSYETRSQKTTAGDTVERAFLTVVSDAGAVRTFEVGGTTSVRILDGGLRRDLDEYLALLASTQSQQVRHLTLEAQGTGTRDLRVSYISEVPVWKSTYRIVFPESKSGEQHRGRRPRSCRDGRWSTTPSARTGSTCSFRWSRALRRALSSRFRSRFTRSGRKCPCRKPRTLRRSCMRGHSRFLLPHRRRRLLPRASWSTARIWADCKRSRRLVAAQISARLRPASGRLGSGTGGGTISDGSMRMYRYLQDESASASSGKFDDYFEYTVAQPVTIHKNESALVPVLQTNVQADRVTLYNAASPVPLRALWLTNSSNLTLDRGSFSIFENNEFAGEGLTDTIHAGEKRLLSYAVDQAVHVTTEGHLNSTHLHHLTVHDGIMTERNEEIREVTYVVHNAASDSRNVIIEHPVQNGWKLTSEVKPVETSASFYRFSVAAQAGETVRLHVGEAHTQGVSYQLTGVGDDQLEVILNGSGERPAVEKALAPVLEARAKVNGLDTQIDVKQAAIDDLAADQKRLHDNLAGLKDSAEERELARRYAGEMNTDEDQLLIARKDRAVLEQQRKEAQQALDAAIRTLDLDQDV